MVVKARPLRDAVGKNSSLSSGLSTTSVKPTRTLSAQLQANVSIKMLNHLPKQSLEISLHNSIADLIPTSHKPVKISDIRHMRNNREDKVSVTLLETVIEALTKGQIITTISRQRDSRML